MCKFWLRQIAKSARASLGRRRGSAGCQVGVGFRWGQHLTVACLKQAGPLVTLRVQLKMTLLEPLPTTSADPISAPFREIVLASHSPGPRSIGLQSTGRDGKRIGEKAEHTLQHAQAPPCGMRDAMRAIAVLQWAFAAEPKLHVQRRAAAKDVLVLGWVGLGQEAEAEGPGRQLYFPSRPVLFWGTHPSLHRCLLLLCT